MLSHFACVTRFVASAPLGPAGSTHDTELCLGNRRHSASNFCVSGEVIKYRSEASMSSPDISTLCACAW